MNRAGTSNASSSANKGASAPSNSARSFFDRGAFAKDISSMMYAFGDVPNPSPASVGLMEELVVDFMVDLCMRARPSPLAVPQANPAYPPTARLKAKVEDFKHALRREPKYLARLHELLYMEFVIQEARKTFDGNEYGREEAQPNTTGSAPRATGGEGGTLAPPVPGTEPGGGSGALLEHESRPDANGKRARPSTAESEPKKRRKSKKDMDEGGGSRKGKARADAGSPVPGSSPAPPAQGSVLPGLALPGVSVTSAHPTPAQPSISLPGSAR